MKSQVPEFLRTFYLKFPIIQAPMAGASTVELAATVTSLNGLGSIPIGDNTENTTLISSQIDKFKSLVSDKSLERNVNINFFAHEIPQLNGQKEDNWIKKYKQFYESKNLNPISLNSINLNKRYTSFKTINDESNDTIKLLVDLKPRIISFHFGLPPSNIINRLQKNGIKIFVSVTNTEEFQIAINEKVDGVVLQGWEAGGHRGNFKANDTSDEQQTTEELVKTIIKYIESKAIENPPFLIAAGGIYDTEGINKLLSYGIAAVQLGTVWLPTTQATVSNKHRELIKTPQIKPLKTIMTPTISGRTLRTIESKFLNELATSKLETVPDYPIPYALFKSLNADAKKENVLDFLPFLAGSNYDKSYKSTDDPKEVFKQLINGLKY